MSAARGRLLFLRFTKRLIGMASYSGLLKEISKSPKGPQVCAFFDFDGTIIAGFSAMMFLKEQIFRGDLSVQNIADLYSSMRQYSSGQMTFESMMECGADIMKGTSEKSYREFGALMYEKEIAKRIFPESRKIIVAHLAQGHTVAIVSSATPYQVEFAAHDLGVEHVMCSQYEVVNGMFTGKVVSPVCFGEGKLIAANKLAKEQKTNLKNSYFYTDSDDDLELLLEVAKPKVINPNKALAAEAAAKNWPVYKFTSRGIPSISTVLRSVAATGSFVGSYALGLPLWALNGSKREAQNFSMSLFGDLASALVGLDLDVTGEENLWKRRPAVVIMNHQSSADSIIMSKLLRRDAAGVGKKEIAESPILGAVIQYAGVVLIDRKNSANAIEAMAPLVDVLKNDKQSVIIAPEGTRTTSTKLAPFKKGPFHLALQAGVPIIPVVIHNSIDVLPKSAKLYRAATVKVDVLPPIDTSSWTVEAMDTQVAEARGLYLKALGQEEPDAVSVQRVPVKAPAKRVPKKKAVAKAKRAASASK